MANKVQYIVIDGFHGKYEINKKAEVRNVKSHKVTKPYHVSAKKGPMVHLMNVKTGESDRVSAEELASELFAKAKKKAEAAKAKKAKKATSTKDVKHAS